MNNNISPKSNRNTASKQKRKFNIIDFFILLIILAVVAALVYAFSPWSQIKKLWKPNQTTFQYAIALKEVDDEFVNLIKSGDSVINSVTKNSMGTVDRVGEPTRSTVLDYQKDDSAADGTVVYKGVLTEKSDKYDIIVYVTTTAEYEQGVGYTVNGSRIAVGEELFLRFPHFEYSGYCIAID